MSETVSLIMLCNDCSCEFHCVICCHLFHILQEATNIEPNESAGANVESWRSAVDNEVQSYVKNHYPNGACTVSSSHSLLA